MQLQVQKCDECLATFRATKGFVIFGLFWDGTLVGHLMTLQFVFSKFLSAMSAVQHVYTMGEFVLFQIIFSIESVIAIFAAEGF